MSSEKFSEGLRMRALISTVAGPRGWNDTRESWLARAARRAGISHRAAKSLWYGEIQDGNHRAARLMRDAAEKYENLASALNHNDPLFHGQDIAALLDLARQLRAAAADDGSSSNGPPQSGMAATNQD